ncbi:MAG: tail fiber domain-containing protein [Bacteroidales bacterium]|jgi:hypothetical protein|nr:tail fiber domain-containing protein [Bacteroidales bacterium]
MKKVVLLLGFTICTSIVFAQLKVTNDGKVGVGLSSSQTPISNFTVGTVGEQYIRSMFESDIVTVGIHCLANSPYGIGYWGTALQIGTDVNSTRGDKGIACGVGKSAPSSSGRAIAIAGNAYNATPGYNYGVIGCLGGSNSGTGILGTVGNDQGLYIDGTYAGYFDGNVKVTGTITAVSVSNSDIRYKQNVEEFGKSSNVLNDIIRLNPISYNYKQVYLEPESDTVSVKRGLFDEKSQMFQKKHFGLIAQDLQKIYPNLVYEEDNGFLSVNYDELVPLLIQSIKELKQEVDRLGTVTSRSATSTEFVVDAQQAVLYQNAPNPFSERTEIKFSLPGNVVNASIYIFNMQGTLIKQIPIKKDQSGILISGSELSAGMYLYSLIVNEKLIDTKRMILTK